MIAAPSLTFSRFAAVRLALAVVAVWLCGMPVAHAACTNPAAGEGALIYNGDQHVMQYCSGTIWVGMAGGVASGFTETDPKVGTLTSNKWCTSNAGGTAIVCNQNAPSGAASNGATGLVQFSDGAGGFLSDATAGGELFWDATNHKLGIGTVTPNASALLDLTSTSKGFLPPRMTTAQVTAIATPADGLIAYDTDTDTIKVRANGAWVSLQAGSFSESDPQVGTLTASKWCAANVGGTAIDCTADAPATGAAGAASEVQFRNSGTGAFAADSTLVWDDTNNRLGIGTTSPTYRLHASGNGIVEAMVESTDSRADLLLKGGQAGDANWALMSGYPNAGDFTIREAGVANYLTIKKTTGNVGIGTTTPDGKFTVDTGGTYMPSFDVSNPSGATLQLSNYITTTGTASRKVLSAVQGLVGSSNISNYQGSLAFLTTPSAGAPTERVRIDAAGNVGIGTTAPNAKLVVSGVNVGNVNLGGITIEDRGDGCCAQFVQTTTSGKSTHLYTYASGDFQIHKYGTSSPSAAVLTILNSGNVGIGTTGPTSLLHVYRASGTGVTAAISNNQPNGGLNGTTLLVENRDATGVGDAATVYRLPSVDWFTGVDNDNADNFRIVPQAEPSTVSTGLTLTTAGNVGIGTTGPTDLLHIAASSGKGITFTGSNPYIQSADFLTISATNDVVFNPGGSEKTRITAAGRVGIGTVSPTTKLQIDSSGINNHILLKSGAQNWGIGNDGSSLTIGNGAAGAYGTGVYIANGGQSWNALSDITLKSEIETLSVLDRLKDYRAVSYVFNPSGQREIGVVAQSYSLCSRNLYPNRQTGCLVSAMTASAQLPLKA